ncbi:3-deoxy-D-arabinoheptulosonate-7-phosphate synthase [Streptomyces sp. SLBN-118]|uniref:3-deoxy-7-phosphoheptulonate synthase n=1 Tax=Streptomyces sp. SLBN-118 TaxID=2768454 RepID=UPI00114EE19D|nr:3-deoxy-7-phosphoheptulonate synthase [Streptomyces sp. SLBN-118]TQK42784.1 3-deoxy-D-arabinoheptulosonate-7-phosphate synthase [Streptomyces sp. SLBN-118]
MEDLLSETRFGNALHQPQWSDPVQARRLRHALAARPALVRPQDLRTLSGLLAQVAAERCLVVQCGDCSEDPAECTPAHVSRKIAVLELLAGTLRMATARPVVRVGRIAGQFAKPRTHRTEQVGDLELPSYQGHMVNGPQPTPDSRRPDPLRILTGYMAASDIMSHLGWAAPPGSARIDAPVWTSHEALLLDYEVPMLRRDEAGRLYLGSTHWPWIGERTRQVDGAHVALLAAIANPVACKVGPTISPGELLGLCERLDPERQPGRLTLIARMGADTVADRLPGLVAAVRAAGHPVSWLTDPLHGNTVQRTDGTKTRVVQHAIREVVAFRQAVRAGGGIAGGLHLETTPDAVLECVGDETDLARTGEQHSTSLCDPRLNLDQALSVVSAFSARTEYGSHPFEEAA